MTTNASLASHLDWLQDAGIITLAQKDTAMIHPGACQLREGRDVCLAWLVSSGILDDPGLLRSSRHAAGTGTARQRAQLQAAIAGALFQLAERENVNKPALDALLSARLITRPERHRALAASDPRRKVASTPGRVLLWMDSAGVLGPGRLEEIRSARGPHRTASRAGILADLDNAISDMRWSAHAGPHLPQAPPNPWLGWLVPPVLLLLFIAAVMGLYDLTSADPMRECWDPIVVEKVQERLAKRDMFWPGNGWGKPDKPAPVIQEIMQIGRSGKARSRSPLRRICKASIVVGNTSGRDGNDPGSFYYFTIERTDFAWDGFKMADF
ncbi:hypothetical protein OU994_00375 [Pseudoduganella sp. SL102]|uniref:hypothetical protein n=1 Tax=Pseudoduganella sp. SL102 TaxID=2995154 RepID=UPI00248BCD47|nr:hypothetical protein [Pseudoduganella sp. SL102]WBS02796.1 hypothetical protein OU994_00375 [Pseudoduganella sp. SL102]